MNYTIGRDPILSPKTFPAHNVGYHFLYTFIPNVSRSRWTHESVQVGLFTKSDLDFFLISVVSSECL